MGSSAPYGKSETYSWVYENIESIESILDIGPGEGTYFKLLSSLKKFNWTGVEAWKDYIDEFKLEEKYDKIYNQDIRSFDWNNKFFDLIIAGDVLEHMTKDEAISLVNTCMDHCKILIISIPIVYLPQEAINGNPFEVHVKPDWSDKEVLETWEKYIKKHHPLTMVGIYYLTK